MKTYTKANKLNIISMLALLWLGSFGVFGQIAPQLDWKWQNPLPTGNILNDVQTLSKNQESDNSVTISIYIVLLMTCFTTFA
jgi:hypothetical protein